MVETALRRKRVLIIVSAYAPAMIADMQRARMLAWELPKSGWDVEILTPGVGEVRQDVVEPQPSGFFVPGGTIHEVGSRGGKFFAALGVRNNAWRTLWTIKQKGDQLIGTGRFDLLYFSTTTFIYFVLGRFWGRKFGLPYVLDFHDPWARPDGEPSRAATLKSTLSQWLSRCMERFAVCGAAGIVAVSPAYLEMLLRRYAKSNAAWLTADRHAVIPFGALESDLLEAAKGVIPPARQDTAGIDVNYVGAGGAIMVRSFELFCRALAALRAHGNPLVDRVRVRLYGTTYGWKPGDAKPLERIAADNGVVDLVAEMPERVSYRRSLELLLEGDGALILGVDEAGYMPSKLFGYALSSKPLVASFRRDGPAFALFSNTVGLGHALGFERRGELPEVAAASVVEAFLVEASERRQFDRRALLVPHLAPAMAARHAALFDACLARNGE